MVNFTFIHAADIHLDSPLVGLSAYEGAPLELLRDAPRAAFRNLVDEAIREQVNFMVIAGDLYDGNWPDFNTGLFFTQEMGRLNRENIPVFIVNGNHDAQSKLTKQLSPLDNVTVFTSRNAETHQIVDIDVALHGQSFRNAKTEENLAINYPAAIPNCFNIGILHTAVEGHAAHASYAPCAISDLVDKEYDYWALGHVHEYKVLKTSPLIAFPGNIQGRHIRETGPRGALLVTVENDKPSIERLFVDTIRWHHLDVNVEAAQSFDDVVQLTRHQLQSLIQDDFDGLPLAVRVTISGSTRAHGELFGLERQLRQEILATAIALSEDKLWIEKVKLATTPTLDKASIEARSDAIADLQAYLDKAGNDEDLQQTIIGELMELVNKVPLDLIDITPELQSIQAGDIKDQLDSVSQGLIAHMSSGEGAK
ncbi:MAG: DNA repair exonuclease [Magnetovibrio sp.]|nr:DNA repair exonuclease [Magnetovibrio sp.]